MGAKASKLRKLNLDEENKNEEIINETIDGVIED